MSPTSTLKWPEPNKVQITCNTSNAYHVRHVVCHVVRRDSSVVKSDRVEIAFIFFFYWLNDYPMKEQGDAASRTVHFYLSVTALTNCLTGPRSTDTLYVLLAVEQINKNEETSLQQKLLSFVFPSFLCSFVRTTERGEGIL